MTCGVRGSVSVCCLACKGKKRSRVLAKYGIKNGRTRVCIGSAHTEEKEKIRDKAWTPTCKGCVVQSYVFVWPRKKKLCFGLSFYLSVNQQSTTGFVHHF